MLIFQEKCSVVCQLTYFNATLLDERILTASTSVTMTKRRADDKGQPCLIPLLILIGSDIQPLLDITGVIFEYITNIP